MNDNQTFIGTRSPREGVIVGNKKKGCSSITLPPWNPWKRTNFLTPRSSNALLLASKLFTHKSWVATICTGLFPPRPQVGEKALGTRLYLNPVHLIRRPTVIWHYFLRRFILDLQFHLLITSTFGPISTPWFFSVISKDKYPAFRWAWNQLSSGWMRLVCHVSLSGSSSVVLY